MLITHRHRIRSLWLLACVCVCCTAAAQCPVNIGFEDGSFANWNCSIGFIGSTTGIITMDPGNGQPTFSRHTLIRSSDTRLDYYGKFPITAPNGSNYSIRLGDSLTNREAERVSYTFTIPADDNNYSIIYDYAVVFQNPDHASWEQPKFTANVFDVTNNSYITCSSFAYTASSSLPGFKQSKLDSSVFYKTWTPVTIKLSGFAAHTIRLEFTTNDCTRGGHFGYAYIDVNQNCSSPISGNIQCLTDTAQTLVAPFGFSDYRWFNDDFSQQLGTGQLLHFRPPPASNSIFAVEVTPFPGQGCIDTVYSTIVSIGQELRLGGPAVLPACFTTPVDLTASSVTAGSSPGLVYSYYLDPQLTSQLAYPKKVDSGGVFYIKGQNAAGCLASRQVNVQMYHTPDFAVTDPPPVVRPSSVNLMTTLSGTGVLDYTFWTDEKATLELIDPYAVNMSGRYYIEATNPGGCFLVKPVNVVVTEPLITPANAFSPNGDGMHDKWEIPGLAMYPDCVVDIYNRYGQLLFHSRPGYPEPWDGKFKGADLPVATYYFMIKLRSDLKAIAGSVSIIR